MNFLIGVLVERGFRFIILDDFFFFLRVILEVLEFNGMC